MRAGGNAFMNYSYKAFWKYMCLHSWPRFTSDFWSAGFPPFDEQFLSTKHLDLVLDLEKSMF